MVPETSKPGCGDNRRMDIVVHPATAERWPDLLVLFGSNGAYSNCWCTWWRLGNAEFSAASPQSRRDLLEGLFESGTPPGLLAYRGEQPVGWISLGAREGFPRLQRSTKLKPIDEAPVCSIVCFFISKDHRRTGVANALLDAAAVHAARAGFDLLEGYPIDTSLAEKRPADLFTGSLEFFERHGFEEVGRRGGRPIVRKAV